MKIDSEGFCLSVRATRLRGKFCGKTKERRLRLGWGRRCAMTHLTRQCLQIQFLVNYKFVPPSMSFVGLSIVLLIGTLQNMHNLSFNCVIFIIFPQSQEVLGV